MHIKEYDLKKKKCVSSQKVKDGIIDTDRMWQYSLLRVDGKILLASEKHNLLIIYDVTNDTQKLYVGINLGYSSCVFQSYKSTLFILYPLGEVYALDTVSGKSQKISSLKCDEGVVFGSKWIYVKTADNSLYRIAQNGSAEEKIFG